MGGKHGAGKGDTYRRVDQQKYADNYDKIFVSKKDKKKNEKHSTSKTKQRRRTDR
jgi:hypothetical protein